MKKYDLLPFSEPAQLAQAAAEAWMDELDRTNREGRPQRVALSGGRIAQQFFSAAVQSARRRKTSFARVDFFWADERCVPADDPESNFGLARKLLLEPLQITSPQLHRIRGELRPEEGAKQATAELRKVLSTNSDGAPVLDLVFLGMGEDGHVASLFPGMPPAQLESAEPYLAVTAPKPPPHRISLSLDILAAAREAWVLVSGPGKEEALRECLTPGSERPLGRLINRRERTRIYSDIRVGLDISR